MWYPSKAVAGEFTEPLTLDDAKQQCRVNSSDEDAQLNSLITTARDHVEKYCNIRLGSQTFDAVCDSFDDFGHFSEAPVQSITSIAYIDVSGASQTLSSSVYELRAFDLEVSIVLKYAQAWPAIQTGSQITVRAVVGYATVPASPMHAMKILVNHWFENRDLILADKRMEMVPVMVDDLLCNYRRGA